MHRLTTHTYCFCYRLRAISTNEFLNYSAKFVFLFWKWVLVNPISSLPELWTILVGRSQSTLPEIWNGQIRSNQKKIRRIVVVFAVFRDLHQKILGKTSTLSYVRAVSCKFVLFVCSSFVLRGGVFALLSIQSIYEFFLFLNIELLLLVINSKNWTI